ncbi:hypothetical protein K1719_008889 [Acacia pycnantha]|nr:hypothetical protein K1719_008889 [Acacia pycnantha]
MQSQRKNEEEEEQKERIVTKNDEDEEEPPRKMGKSHMNDLNLLKLIKKDWEKAGSFKNPKRQQKRSSDTISRVKDLEKKTREALRSQEEEKVERGLQFP